MLWSGTRWPERLRDQAAVGGESGRRANRDLDAICALFDIAHRSEEVSGLRGGDRVPGRGGRAADPGRHAGGGRSARFGGPAADRAPGQGPGVGPGRGGRRPGGCVAGHPAPRLAAGAGPARSARVDRDRADRVPDRGGATAVLRRLHPGPSTAGGDRGRRDGRGGRSAVPVPDRAGRSRGARRRPPAPAADPGRTGRRAAADLRGPGGATRPARGGGRVGWPGWRTPSTSTVGRWCRWPTRFAGGGWRSCRMRPSP